MMNATSALPSTWAKALGMVPVPMFGSARMDEPEGMHVILLDGDKASLALSIGNPDFLLAGRKPQSWSWSSNLTHSWIVDPNQDELFISRWDQPDRVDRRPLPSPHEIGELVEKQASEPKPTATTVIKKMLRTFRQVRSNIELAGGTDVDLIRTFNALLVLADVTRREVFAAPADFGDGTLREVLPVLLAANLIDFGPELLSESVKSFSLMTFLEEILSREPDTGVLLDPDLFIRHATGILYQEAHIELTDRPINRVHNNLHQRTLFPIVSLDESRPSVAPNSDAHFTPPSLARALIQEAIRAMGMMRKLPHRIKVLDPACGSGVFLIEAAREIAATTEQKVFLTGIDRSPISCIMTNFCLRHSASDDSSQEPSYRIYEKDSLQAKSWGQPDLILMNPPFISWEDMKPGDKEAVRAALGDRYGRLPDTSIAFVARALDCMKPGSVLATVVPGSFLDSSAAEKLRAHINEDPSYSVKLIGKFRDLEYFQGATVEPALLVIAKNTRLPLHEGEDVRFVVAESGHADRAIRGLRRRDADRDLAVDGWEVFRGSSSVLSANTWLPLSRRPAGLLSMMALAGTPRVRDLFTVAQGVQTGNNGVFVVNQRDLSIFSFDPGFNLFFRKTADQIQDGVILDSDYIFYPFGSNGESLINDEKHLIEVLPTFYSQRLKPNRLPLLNRTGRRNKPWWALNESRLDWQPYTTPKIVTTAFGKAGSFAYDARGDYVVHQGNAWFFRNHSEDTEELRLAYLAILNSRIFEAMIGLTCPRVQGGQFNINKKYIGEVRIPPLSTGPGTEGAILSELAEIGRTITTGLWPDPDTIDKVVARAYGIPLYRIVAAILPNIFKEKSEQFRLLASQWKRETCLYSSVTRRFAHPAYQAIISLGDVIIPFVLEELREKPDFWFESLKRLVGSNPFTISRRTSAKEMREAWLAWGETQGIFDQ